MQTRISDKLKIRSAATAATLAKEATQPGDTERDTRRAAGRDSSNVTPRTLKEKLFERIEVRTKRVLLALVPEEKRGELEQFF